MVKKYVIIPDTQLPFEDKKALKAVLNFIGEYQPDEVVHIGDVMDYPTPSRWSKDTAMEYRDTWVEEHTEYAKKNLMEPLRAVYDGPVGFLEGNHDERPRVYLSKYAVALGSYAEWFDFSNLLDFDGFGVTKLPHEYRFAPGWVAIHGHRHGIRLTQEAGRTALNAAINKFHTSVIMGHTHRLGKISKSFGFPGAMTSYTGMEVGNLMDMRKADYLKGGPANWQQGFAIVHVDGKHVKAEPIEITNNKFIVEGNTYNVR